MGKRKRASSRNKTVAVEEPEVVEEKEEDEEMKDIEENDVVDDDDMQKKDNEIVKKIPNILSSMEEYEPTIPDQVIDYYLEKSGCNCSDVRVKRVIALAIQKFIFQVASDAKNHHDVRTERKLSKPILSMEDLCASLEENGIPVVKPEYFVQ